MPSEPLNLVLRTIRRLVGERGDEADDARLLERFAQQRDEVAFAELVQRHGPLVLGVCRRVLRHEQDAEDAFQATFLVLARKAGSIRNRQALGSWLYEVAYHMALRARADAARRRQREEEAGVMARTDGSTTEGPNELQPILDEELHHLPEQDRRLLVLCYLQGKTHQQAARELGWPPGSLSRRLGHALEMLRERLRRRGVLLAVGALAAALTAEAAAAPISAALLAPTVQAALLFATGKLAGTATASAPAARLAEGALHAMFMSKLKLGFALALTLAVVAGAGVLAYQTLSAGPAPVEPPALPPAQAEKPPLLDLFGDPLPPGALARLGTVRFRLGGWGESVTFTPDGKALVTAGLGSYARLWDGATGRELRQFGQPPLSSARRAALSPDGLTLASGHNDGTIRLWETATGKQLRSFQKAALAITALAFSPDGKRLAVASEIDWPPRGQVNPVRLWDVVTGTEVLRFEGHTDTVHTVAFAPDGKTLATGGGRYDPTLRLWDAATGKVLQVCKGHEGELWSVAFSPYGRTVASGSMDKSIRLWDAASGNEKGRLGGHREDVVAVAFAPDGKKLASGSFDATLRIWDIDRGVELRRFEGHEGGFQSVAFSRDGTTLAAGGRDHTLRLWELPSGKELQPHDSQLDGVFALAVAPDGRTIATGGGDRAVRLWDAGTGKEIRVVGRHDGWVECLAFSPDGTLLASGSLDKTARLWDVATGRELQRFAVTDEVNSLAFAPDGKILATANRFTGSVIHLWDVDGGKEVARFDAPGEGLHGVTCVAFAPDGKALAAGSYDGVIRLWDHRLVRVIGPTTMRHERCACLVFSADGRTLATSDLDGDLRLWETATGKERRHFRGHPCSFSPDGRVLVAGSEHGIDLWDLAADAKLTSLTGHRGSIAALAFSPDGARLVSGSWDTTALVWDTSALPAAPLPPNSADERPTELWAALGSADAAVAYRAGWRLTRRPAEAVALFGEQLRPVVAADPVRLSRLIADLDSDEFAVREKAARELEQLGELARVAVQKNLLQPPSLNVRQRLQQLLEKMNGTDLAPEVLRGIRAVEVLERIKTPEARALLAKLAGGAEGVRLTEEARSATTRASQRSTP
jgi:RNA polymerase sigma factor (sigma-70 family)